MNLKLHDKSVGSLNKALAGERCYYLDAGTVEAIEEILDCWRADYQAGLWNRILAALPLEKQHPESMHRRIEGLNYAAERLWDEALQIGKQAVGPDFSSEKLRRVVRSHPLSHYHYLTGSREPQEILLTRRDGLYDPRVALAKLRHDIEELTNFILRFAGTPHNPAANSGVANPT